MVISLFISRSHVSESKPFLYELITVLPTPSSLSEGWRIGPEVAIVLEIKPGGDRAQRNLCPAEALPNISKSQSLSKAERAAGVWKFTL